MFTEVEQFILRLDDEMHDLDNPRTTFPRFESFKPYELISFGGHCSY